MWLPKFWREKISRQKLTFSVWVLFSIICSWDNSCFEVKTRKKFFIEINIRIHGLLLKIQSSTCRTNAKTYYLSCCSPIPTSVQMPNNAYNMNGSLRKERHSKILFSLIKTGIILISQGIILIRTLRFIKNHIPQNSSPSFSHPTIFKTSIHIITSRWILVINRSVLTIGILIRETREISRHFLSLKKAKFSTKWTLIPLQVQGFKELLKSKPHY